MYDSLIDARTGIITALVPAPIPDHFPAGYALTHARLNDASTFSQWPVDSTGAGYAFTDPDAVTGAAIGEAVERYCGNLPPTGLITATHRQLSTDNLAALDPSTVCLYSENQYNAPGFPAAPMTPDLLIEWVAAADEATGQPVLVPASLVWVSYFTRPRSVDRPLTNPVIQAGLAAHRTRALAVNGALAEIIERDAMTLCWYGGLGLTSLRVPDWLAHYARGRVGALSTRFARLANEFDVPVITALVFDNTTGYLTLGAGVNDDPVTAATKAFGEALQLQLFSAELHNPASGYARTAGQPGSPLKTWRADRHYAQSYRPDLADVIDYGCHLQLHLDPNVQTKFLLDYDTAIAGEQDLTDIGSLPGQGHSTISDWDVTRVLTEAGYQVLVVDVTTPDVAAAGLHAVRALVPGLYSNSAIGLPFHGGTRFHSARAHARHHPTMPLPH